MHRSNTGPADRGADDAKTSTGNDQSRYLFPVDGEHPNALLRIVCDLVADAQADLFVGMPVTVPEQTPLSAPRPISEGERRAAKYLMKARERCTGAATIRQAVSVGHRRAHILEQLIESYSIETLVVEDQPHSTQGSLLGAQGFEITIPSRCDTVVVTRIDLPDSIESVLVPVASGPHSGMAIDVGRALARETDAAIELLHVYEDGDDQGREQGGELLHAGMERLGDLDAAEQTLRGAEEISEAVIEYTEDFDVVILGAPREGLLRQFVMGTVPERVSAAMDGTVLIAHRGGTEESWLDRLI